MYAIQYNVIEVINMADDALLQSLGNELKRGTQILAVLSQLDKTEYGYSLLQKLEEKNISIEAGTLYPLLRRLESQKLLESQWDTTENRPRKYYTLSSYGQETFDNLKEIWKEIVNEINSLLGEGF